MKHILQRAALLLIAASALLSMGGCAAVSPSQRAYLADQIMERQDHFSKQTLAEKFFSSREGSIGGASGIGGGCGCAK